MAGSYNRAVFHENRHFLDTDCNIVELFLSIFYIYKQKNHFMITSNCEVRRNYTTKIKPARNNWTIEINYWNKPIDWRDMSSS